MTVCGFGETAQSELSRGSRAFQRALQQRAPGQVTRPRFRLTIPAPRTIVPSSLLDSYRQGKGQDAAESPQKAPLRRTRHPRGVADRKSCSDEDDDDALCTPECVREIHTADEFNDALETANPSTLIVVDFYKTACGSCRYIQPGFVKLCHSSEEEHAPVIFLKHNVIDEADQDTDLSEQLRIRNVPLFQFYKDNALLEQFATREKKRIGNAINTYVGRDVCHL